MSKNIKIEENKQTTNNSLKDNTSTNNKNLPDNLEYNPENDELVDINRLSIHSFTGNGKEIFSTYKSKYENTMSSAIILLFLGIAGIISTILFITDTIHVALTTFQYIFLGIIYIMFLVYGIISYFKAIEYKSLINDENSHEKNILTYLKNNITSALLDSFRDESISEEENYVIYVSKIVDMVLETYPDYDRALIEYHIDEYLNKNF